MPAVHKQNALFLRRAQTEFSPSRAVPAPRNPAVEEKVFSLFQPDVLVSTQYFATTKSKTYRAPEQRLLLAVFEDAVWCFQNGLLSKDKRKRALSMEAEEWLMKENGDRLFSFTEICELLGLESKYIRKQLLRWKKNELRGRTKTNIYRLTHGGGKKRKTTAGEKRHRFLNAAGF